MDTNHIEHEPMHRLEPLPRYALSGERLLSSGPLVTVFPGLTLTSLIDRNGGVWFECLGALGSTGHPCTSDALKRFVAELMPLTIAALKESPGTCIRVMPLIGVLRLLLYSPSRMGDKFRVLALPGLRGVAATHPSINPHKLTAPYHAITLCRNCGIASGQRALVYFAEGEYSAMVLPGRKGRSANHVTLDGAALIICGTVGGAIAVRTHRELEIAARIGSSNTLHNQMIGQPNPEFAGF